MKYGYTKSDTFLSLGMVVVGVAIIAAAMIKIDNPGYKYLIIGIIGSLMAVIGAALFIFIRGCQREK